MLVRPDLAPFVQAGGDGVKVTWVPAQETLETGHAFDHEEIVVNALKRIRGKTDYSSIPFELVPKRSRSARFERCMKS